MRQIWKHRSSGDMYVVVLTDRVEQAAGPLHHSEIEAALAGDFNDDPELAEQINEDQDFYDWVADEKE